VKIKKLMLFIFLSGASLSLFSMQHALSIEDVVSSYLKNYIVFLKELRRERFDSECIQPSLERIIDDYCAKFYFKKGQLDAILNIVNKKKEQILRKLKSEKIRKRYLPKALLYFRQMFICKRQQEDQAVMTPCIVERELNRLKKKMNKGILPRFNRKLCTALRKERFLDLEIVCAQ